MNKHILKIATVLFVAVVCFITTPVFGAGASKPKRKSVSGEMYYHCETRSRDGRETQFAEYGSSYEIAKQKAMAACVKKVGEANCYPISFCLPISVNTPIKCSVSANGDLFEGYGIDWTKAEEAARRVCLAYATFATCIAARSETCINIGPIDFRPQPPESRR